MSMRNYATSTAFDWGFLPSFETVLQASIAFVFLSAYICSPFCLLSSPLSWCFVGPHYLLSISAYCRITYLSVEIAGIERAIYHYRLLAYICSLLFLLSSGSVPSVPFISAVCRSTYLSVRIAERAIYHYFEASDHVL